MKSYETFSRVFGSDRSYGVFNPVSSKAFSAATSGVFRKFLLAFLLSKAYNDIPHKSKKHETALRKCRGK